MPWALARPNWTSGASQAGKPACQPIAANVGLELPAERAPKPVGPRRCASIRFSKNLLLLFSAILLVLLLFVVLILHAKD